VLSGTEATATRSEIEWAATTKKWEVASEFVDGKTVSYEAPEGISSEIGGGNKKLFGGERKFCGFFFVLSYSHEAYLDYGGIHFSPFLRRCLHNGSTLQAFLCHPPRPITRR